MDSSACVARSDGGRVTLLDLIEAWLKGNGDTVASSTGDVHSTRAITTASYGPVS